MALKTSSKEDKKDAPKSVFLKGAAVGTLCTLLLSAVVFTHQAQEKEVSQEEVFTRIGFEGTSKKMFENDPIFSSPEWITFSKALAEKNRKMFHDDFIEDGDKTWFPDLNERRSRAREDNFDNLIYTLDKEAQQNAVNLALATCQGRSAEDLSHLRILYSEGLIEGQNAIDKTVAELTHSICKK